VREKQFEHHLMTVQIAKKKCLKHMSDSPMMVSNENERRDKMMTIQRRRDQPPNVARGGVTPVLGVLAAMLMVAGLCSTAFASTRSVASVSARRRPGREA